MSLFQTTYDPLTKIWSGRPMAPTYHPNVNAAQVLLDAMNRNPQKTGQINVKSGMKLTNGELRISTIRVAQNLQRLGIRSGDVVAVMAANRDFVSSVVIGAMALAAPVNILGVNFSTVEITHMLGLTSPKIICCDSSYIDGVRLALQKLAVDIPIYTFDENQNESSVNELLLETENENGFSPTMLNDGHNQAALIMCTSGTTGLCKGIQISHAMILYQFSHQMDVKADDVYFVNSPMSWLTAIFALISTTLMGATRVITTDEVTPELLLHIMETFRISITILSLHTVSLLLKCPNIETTDLSSITRIYCGGSVLCHLQLQRMNQYLSNGRIYMVYGLSEVPGYTSLGLLGDCGKSVGLLGPGQRIRILDDNNICCGPNEEGEINIEGEIPYMGYFKDEIRTVELMTEDGWIRTGDIGRFDSKGFLYITDRKKEMLKYKGENVSPALVENIVLRIPGVKAVCVVGVFDKDIEEKPTAIIVQDGHHTVTEKMIQNHVDDNFYEKKFLCGGVYFVDNLPKTHSGKVKRRGVKAIATQLYNR